MFTHSYWFFRLMTIFTMFIAFAIISVFVMDSCFKIVSIVI